LRDLLPPGRLIVAGPDPLGADAVHLAEADPLPVAGVALIGRSCHGSPRLTIEDYVTLSPMYPSASKPGYGPALAPAAAAELAGDVPWLALGGIDTPSRAAACATVGARGIAVMGSVMGAADPERVARELASAFGAARSARAARDLRPATTAITAGSARPIGSARPAGIARPSGPPGGRSPAGSAGPR
jgi:hypothetical protein